VPFEVVGLATATKPFTASDKPHNLNGQPYFRGVPADRTERRAHTLLMRRATARTTNFAATKPIASTTVASAISGVMWAWLLTLQQWLVRQVSQHGLAGFLGLGERFKG
jgi:hypothetical protein